jgi:hypothetical protein
MRASAWLAAVAVVGTLWLLVLYYVLSFYWTVRGATTVTLGTLACILFFLGIRWDLITATLGAMTALAISVSFLRVEPSLMYVAGSLVLGFFAYRKIDWSSEFAMMAFG